MFRQAMRSPVIMFHVVPSSMKTHYEQLSHPERNPSYPSGRFSPDSVTGSIVPGIDHNTQRMSRHGSQTHPHSHTPQDLTDGYPPLSHPAVSAAKPPIGHAHSPQRGLNSTPTPGFTKKVGRRLNIQLKKGEMDVSDDRWKHTLVFTQIDCTSFIETMWLLRFTLGTRKVRQSE